MTAHVAIAGLLLLVSWPSTASAESPFRQGIQQADSGDAFRARWKEETNEKLVLGVLWTVTHTISDEARARTSLAPVMTYLEGLEKGDRAILEAGAIAAFKKRLSALLDDSDQGLRALGAVLLGVCGDKSYAKQVARLLEPRSVPDDMPRVDRGRSAIALGLLGATEYTSELAGLLKSPNSFDRSGAALGLGLLGARQYESAIAALLNDPEGDVSDTAKESLAIMRRPPR